MLFKLCITLFYLLLFYYHSKLPQQRVGFHLVSKYDMPVPYKSPVHSALLVISHPHFT